MLLSGLAVKNDRNTTSRFCLRRRLAEGFADGDILSIAVIGPIHGFASCLSGCLIFRRDTDWSLIGLTAVEVPLGGMMAGRELVLVLRG